MKAGAKVTDGYKLVEVDHVFLWDIGDSTHSQFTYVCPRAFSLVGANGSTNRQPLGPIHQVRDWGRFWQRNLWRIRFHPKRGAIPSFKVVSYERFVGVYGMEVECFAYPMVLRFTPCHS
jgi:hypothetical protein